MPSKKLTLPISQIISDYGSGMNCRQLGKKYGVSYNTILSRLRDHGVEIRNRGDWDCGRKEITLPISQIISDYESGMNCRQLGKKYGCAINTIWSRLKEEGVEIRNRGHGDRRNRLNFLPISQIISDYEEGMNSRELGEKYGCSHETILNRLKKEGVSIKKSNFQLRSREICQVK